MEDSTCQISSSVSKCDHKISMFMCIIINNITAYSVQCSLCQHATVSLNFDSSGIDVPISITDTHRSGVSATRPGPNEVQMTL